MDEHKPDRPQSPEPAAESQAADSSLVSKLARAYSSLPPEQRGANALPGSGDAVANPEVEDRFQKLLKQLEVLETYQGRRDHKPDRKVVALLEKKIEELRARGDEPPADGASAKAAPAEEVDALVRGGVRCGKCGQSNSAPVRFCGMCGAELAKSLGASDNGSAPTNAAAAARREPEAPLFSAGRGAERRSRRELGIGFLVLLLAALALLASQQWGWWRQQLLPTNRMAPTPSAPPLPSAGATTAPVPPERSANSASVEVPKPLPAGPKPRKPVQDTRPKLAPPTTIKRPLPGPVPLTSALPQIEAPSSTQPEPEVSQPPAQRTRLSPTVAQGGLIFKHDPEYPAVARLARVQGSVVLHAIIGKDGTVQQLQVVSGNPLLAGPALNAVRDWRYRPYLVDGQAVEVETTVTVNFKGED
jgi:protein TonB